VFTSLVLLYTNHISDGCGKRRLVSKQDMYIFILLVVNKLYILKSYISRVINMIQWETVLATVVVHSRLGQFCIEALIITGLHTFFVFIT